MVIIARKGLTRAIISIVTAALLVDSEGVPANPA